MSLEKNSLLTVFIAQNCTTDDDGWVADSGAPCDIAHILSFPHGRETTIIGDGRRSRVECVESIDVIFHGHTDERHTLFDVPFVPGLGFRLYSLHANRRNRTHHSSQT